MTAGQSGNGGRSSQGLSGDGWSGQGQGATYGLPHNWDWNIPPPQPAPAQGVDPVLAGLMAQQLQLGQTPGIPERERLTMDTKWIPAMPLPSYKQWVSRS